MQAIMQQLALIASQAEETPEERAHRLETVAEETAVASDTLYETEESLRGLGWDHLTKHEEAADQIEQQMVQMAPMLGMDPQRAKEQFGPETAIRLLSMKMVGNPEATAYTVAHINDVFQRTGLYDELGVDVEEGR